MAKKPSVFLIGGFLGAGKTTAIRTLARLFAQQDLKTAAITNDQAEGLVDTFFLAGEGVPALEVAGSCFCCNFNGLKDAILDAITQIDPDVILAEPVGSCTDIVATVIRPMQLLLKDVVEVRAFSVLVEPKRWNELVDDAANVPWSLQFLFHKQMEEADVIVLNKADTLEDTETTRLEGALRRRYPDTPVVRMSARDGLGVDDWITMIRTMPPSARWLQDIDYDKYAVAEAEMGWLNAQITLDFAQPVDGTQIAAYVAKNLAQGITQRQARVGHLKLLAEGETGSIKAGVTVAGEPGQLDGRFTGPVSNLQLTINLRATVSPGDLAQIITSVVTELKAEFGAGTDIAFLNTFRPGRPCPTFRFANP
jgi:G3E family GTPase